MIAYLYLASGESERAERVLRRDLERAAPVLWRSEFRNVLTLHIRQSLLSLEDALGIMADAASLMTGQEYEVAREV